MNTFRKIRIYTIAFIALVALFAVSKEASAQRFASQVKYYQLQTFSAPFQSIIGQAGTTQLNFSGGYYSYPQNSTYVTTTLPFDINYDSTKYTQGSTVEIHQNGAISFGKITNYDYGNSISSNNQTSFPNLINAWGMTYYPYTYSGDYQYSQVTGAIGSRIWTVEFSNDATYQSQISINVQIKIYETSNVIEFWYSQNNLQVGTYYYFFYNGYAGDIGLNGPTNGDYTGFVTDPNTFRSNAPLYTPATQYRMLPLLVPNIQMTVQPKSLIYGPVTIGTSLDKQFTIKNVGTAGTLLVTSVAIVGNSDFTVVGGTPVPPLVVGQSQTVTVRYTPQTFGNRSAILTVTSNGQDSGIQSISLIGSGTGSTITVDSTILFRKTRTRLGDSLTQYVHITAGGNVPLVFTSFPITGPDSQQFIITHFPPVMLPGTVDSLGITYVPTIEGRHSATITINSNSYNAPSIKITVVGTGTLPHIVLTPNLLLFDSTKEGDTVCKNITIWNPGSDTLRIKAQFLSSNDGDFHYTGLSGKDTAIAPDQTKTVSICFIPLQQGSRQARLLLRTNIINTFETPRRDTAGIVTVDIRGTGVPFGVLASSLGGSPILDSSLVGTPVCRIDTLKNNGDADVTVTGYKITGGTVFTQNQLPAVPFVIKARSSMVFTVCGTPNVAGLIQDSLIFTGTSSARTIGTVLSLGIYGFKGCVSASPASLFTAVTLPNNGSDSSQCVQIINCGNVTAVYTPTISGAAAKDYSFKPATSAPVPPNDTAVFCIDYKPSNVGVSTASFDIASSDKSTVSVPLTGADGCAILAVTVDQIPNTGQFDTTGYFNVTINNTGTFDWTPGQLDSIIVTPNTEFSVISVTSTGHAPNQQVIIKMRLHSKLLGNYSAKLTFPNAGPCGNTVSADLNGIVITGSVKETVSADGFVLEQSFPNPTQGKATFTFTMPSEETVNVTLVDLTGKLVRTLITGRVSKGEHIVNFDASNLPSGTYIYVLESGSTRLARQLIVTK